MPDSAAHEPPQQLDEDSEQPSWQTQPCPSWCVQRHQEDDFPEERRHQSPSITVPALWLSQEVSDGAGDKLVAGDLNLLSWPHIDGLEIMVTVADDDYGLCLEVTVESMRRLHHSRGRLLGALS